MLRSTATTRPGSRALGALAVTLLASRVLAAPVVFHIKLGPASQTAASGRLLVFVRALDPAGKGPVRMVDMDQIDVTSAAIAALEVGRLDPGATVDLDADLFAFPGPFSQLKAGRYAVQAVLDRDHSYNYTGRGSGDLVSPVVEMDLPGEAREPLVLTTSIPEAPPIPGASGPADADVHPIEFTSPALSRFWGRKVVMRGFVATPPGYASETSRRYPAVYYTQGFGGDLRSLYGIAVSRLGEMRKGLAPPMIWVGVDQSSPTGTSEFVDSVNNGPWGQALVAELIPDLERRYRMDAKPSGRLLTGHSSGGWAVLWLQVNYPKLFGGAWATSPDPSDFHDFLGNDLYAPGANLYRRADGTPWSLARDKGESLVSVEDFARREDVVGEYGGQIASFEWTFSPRGEDGRPIRMFDRANGSVNPSVMAYWREHYDLSERVRRDWAQGKREVDGKIHLSVGGADTFYLDGAARRLEGTLKSLGARADFHYIEGRGHFNLYAGRDDPWALYKTIAWEMYALARPRSKRPPPPVP
jgi:hypothetical protein